MSRVALLRADPAAAGELWTTFLAGVSSTLFAAVYLWRIAPDLEASCERFLADA